MVKRSGPGQDNGTLWRRFWRGVATVADHLADPTAAGEEEGEDSTFAKAKPKPVSAPSSPPTAVSPESMARTLKSALKKGGVTAGAVHFLDLTGLRAKLGAKWPRMAERVTLATTGCLDQALSQDDVYVALEGPMFVIVFAHLTLDEARLKCAILADRIERRFVGDEDEDMRGLLVRAASARLDGSEGVEAVNLEKVARSIVEREEQALRSQHDPAHPLPRPFPAGAVADDLEADPTAPVLKRTAQGKKDSPTWVATGKGDKGDFDPIMRPPLPPPSPPSDFIYRPMWHTRQNVMATYVCLPIWRDEDGIATIGEHSTQCLPSEIVDTDLAVLIRASQDFRALRAMDRRLILSVPVHFETIAKPAVRAHYAAACQYIDTEDRRYLLFELVGTPQGVSLSRLGAIVGILLSFGRGVNLRTTLQDTDFQTYREARLFGVGVEVGRAAVSDEALINSFQRFVERAERYGLRTYIHGLSSLSMTAAAVGAGFDFIDGDAVTSVTESPVAYRFSIEDMYENLLKPRRS